MFEQLEHPYFEEYLYEDGKITRLVLYIPIQKRTDCNRITINTCDEMLFLASCKNGGNAEKEASQAVMEFLKGNYPYLAQKIREFFRAKQPDGCMCGVKLNRPLYLPQNSDVELLKFDAGKYAVLECECYGKSNIYEEGLLSWVHDNGFIMDDAAVFTVYDALEGFDEKDIRTKIYVKLKNGKNVENGKNG